MQQAQSTRYPDLGDLPQVDPGCEGRTGGLTATHGGRGDVILGLLREGTRTEVLSEIWTLKGMNPVGRGN